SLDMGVLRYVCGRCVVVRPHYTVTPARGFRDIIGNPQSRHISTTPAGYITDDRNERIPPFAWRRFMPSPRMYRFALVALLAAAASLAGPSARSADLDWPRQFDTPSGSFVIYQPQ